MRFVDFIIRFYLISPDMVWESDVSRVLKFEKNILVWRAAKTFVATTFTRQRNENLTGRRIQKVQKRIADKLAKSRNRKISISGERDKKDSPGKKIYIDRDTFIRTYWLIIPHGERLVNFPIDRERRRWNPEEHPRSFRSLREIACVKL